MAATRPCGTTRRRPKMAQVLVSGRDTATLEACTACHQACTSCAYDCCAGGGMAKCTRLCLDCATMCGAMMELLARGSRWAVAMAEVCARVCAECAEECAKLD